MTDQGRCKQDSTEQMQREETKQLFPVLNPEGFSKEDEDFLSGLNPEEKESLEYLLRIINSLDKEILEDDDCSHKNMAESLGSEDPCQSSVFCSRQPQSVSGEPASVKPGPYQRATKNKMIKSLSEESNEVTQRRPDLYCPNDRVPHRSTNSHPTHFRKFDTISRSGVNVQELRSHFLLHLDSSAPVKESTKDISMKPSRLLPEPQRSTRDEALKKLGFLQRNTPFPNLKSPPVPMADQHQIPHTEMWNKEAIAGSTCTN